jgi:hypothetical protein
LSRFLKTWLFARPLAPICAEQLDRVLGADPSIAAAQIIGWAIFIASPADLLGVLRMEGEFRHTAHFQIKCAHSQAL